MTLDSPAHLTADACPYQVVIVCRGCARIAANNPTTAWTLAAAHALGVHGDRAAYQAALKYARQHRNRRK